MLSSYPWYFNDWRSSEAVKAMTSEQRGIYRELLDHCWEHGSLPTDLRLIQIISRATSREFRRSWTTVSRQFEERSGRLWSQKVDEKRSTVLAAKESRTKSASIAASTRWSKKDDASRMPEASASDASRINMPDASECGTPSPSPSMLNTQTHNAAVAAGVFGLTPPGTPSGSDEQDAQSVTDGTSRNGFTPNLPKAENTVAIPSKKPPPPEYCTAAHEIWVRHPNDEGRRDISEKAVLRHLVAIANRQEIGKRLEIVRTVNENHALWTAHWLEFGYTKGLNNWLAPTVERWASRPDAARKNRNGTHSGTPVEKEFDYPMFPTLGRQQ